MVAAALYGADEAFGDACWRMTEGNVFLLQELIAAVRDEGWEPTAQNATRIGTLAPEAVLRAVSVRLMRLSDDAAGIARAVAVLGEDAQLRHIVALTGGAHERVAAGADALAASDILRPLDTGALTLRPPAARLGGLRRHRARASARRCTAGRPRSCTASAPRTSASRRTCCRRRAAGRPGSSRCCAPRRAMR